MSVVQHFKDCLFHKKLDLYFYRAQERIFQKVQKVRRKNGQIFFFTFDKYQHVTRVITFILQGLFKYITLYPVTQLLKKL